ncbi:MAG: ATPase, T2SS/T4P/T4SS family [Nitrospinota bacterium]
MAVRQRKRLGDLLVEAGVLTDDQLKKALASQKETRKKLGEAIVGLGFITDEDILNTLAKQLNIEVVNLEELEVDVSLFKNVPEAIARKYTLIPLKKENNTITVVMADPLNIFAIDEVAVKTGMDVQVAISTEHQVEMAISKHYGVTSSIQDALRAIRGTEITAEVGEDDIAVTDMSAATTDLAPIARLVETVVKQAIRDRASDIHIEPDEDDVKMRYRIDGLLFQNAVAPKLLQSAIISRIKIISNLDISETRIPQDGRFKIIFEEQDVEFRVSTFPTIYGENVVIRILRSDMTMVDMEKTGLIGVSLEKALELLKTPFGITLVTGPTGSGKTTTLYAALNLLNDVEKNIITIEDPVEYRLAGIRQSQINPKAGLTFASGMRSILRQDPDIIMIGEMRDLETADIAIQAAMTGHMVLSTMHTNDAPSAVVRLIELGLEPFLISSSVVGVIAQRLVRTICKSCKEPLPREEALKLLPKLKEGVSLYKGAGCMECKRSGFSGRTGIFEVFAMDEQMRTMVNNRSASSVLKDYAIKKQGMVSMLQDGRIKVAMGLTTMQEINRVTADY